MKRIAISEMQLPTTRSAKGSRVGLMHTQKVQDPNTDSLAVKLAAEASRFLAGQNRSKVVSWRNAPPMVTFTFDDVPASACTIGVRILERYGARGTFYVAAGECGTARPGLPLRASIDQLKTIWENGHEIGCHTHSHPAVSRISFDQLDLELDRNQSVLTASFNRTLPIRKSHASG